MLRVLLLALITVPLGGGAVVVRDDVDDSECRVVATEFPAVVDRAGEGHGMVIAPQWVVTAAHTMADPSGLRQVVLNGVARAVERSVMHPGHRASPGELIDQAMAASDAVLVLVQIAGSDDIALIRLAEPEVDVAPVAPVALYRMPMSRAAS